MNDPTRYAYTEHHVYTHRPDSHLRVEPLEFTAQLRTIRHRPCIVHHIQPASLKRHCELVVQGYDDKPEMLLYARGFPLPIGAQELLSENERGLWSKTEGQETTTAAVRQFLDTLDLPPSPRAVDLGIGDGHNFATLLSRLAYDSALGLDYHISKEYQYDIPVVPTNLNREFPLEDNSVDLLSATCTLGILANPLHGIRESLRVLRPGGHLVIVERNLHTTYFEQHARVRVLRQQTIDALVAAHELPSPAEQVESMMADFPDLDFLLAQGTVTLAEVEHAKAELVNAITDRNEPRTVLPYHLPHYCALVQKI